MLEGWDMLVEIVLTRNPSYHGELPYFDRIVFTHIADAATQRVALEAGEIDIALDINSQELAKFDQNPNIVTMSSQSPYVHYLLMNRNSRRGGAVSDPTVQLAIRYALDYAGYKSLWGGITPATMLSSIVPGALCEEKAIQRDLDKARALLASTEYHDGFDIILSYPDFAWQGVDMNSNAQKIQADLAEIGINIMLNPNEIVVVLDKHRRGFHGFTYWVWLPDILDLSDLFAFMPDGKIAADRAGWTSENADPEIIALRDKAKSAVDSLEREALFTQIQTYMQQKSPFIPFNQPMIHAAFSVDLQGYAFHPQWIVDVTKLCCRCNTKTE
jgi:peptide/nickel transport system substrate-binding protein